jgi:hypothetical protein
MATSDVPKLGGMSAADLDNVQEQINALEPGSLESLFE